MTIIQALRRAGIEAEELEFGWKGKTKSGKNFHMERAGGAYGLQFTLEIEGMNRITHCKLRTAMQRIKAN